MQMGRYICFYLDGLLGLSMSPRLVGLARVVLHRCLGSLAVSGEPAAPTALP